MMVRDTCITSGTKGFALAGEPRVHPKPTPLMNSGITNSMKQREAKVK
jgi:hypothetical protein